ncbi:unnamed protein product [Protopolystoma xenopodis]|uniref:Uncharacterized protein n=1 Tax=Protopolystoma xenopodis TaxID=117903 RepID=A0A448WTT0_9PLAT|nr:unnamed protein product [Protopolystoma xenopodis]
MAVANISTAANPSQQACVRSSQPCSPSLSDILDPVPRETRSSAQTNGAVEEAGSEGVKNEWCRFLYTDKQLRVVLKHFWFEFHSTLAI